MAEKRQADVGSRWHDIRLNWKEWGFIAACVTLVGGIFSFVLVLGVDNERLGGGGLAAMVGSRVLIQYKDSATTVKPKMRICLWLYILYVCILSKPCHE